MKLFLCSHFSSVGSLIKEEIENKKVAFIPTASLRKRELLRIRHFRQLARKNNENFGKKREGWTMPALLTRKNTRLFIIIKL